MKKLPWHIELMMSPTTPATFPKLEERLDAELDRLAQMVEDFAAFDIEVNGRTTRSELRALAQILRGVTIARGNGQLDKLALVAAQIVIPILRADASEQAQRFENAVAPPKYARTFAARRLRAVVRAALIDFDPEGAGALWAADDTERAASAIVDEIQRVLEVYPNVASAITCDLPPPPRDYVGAKKKVLDDLFHGRQPPSGSFQLDTTVDAIIRAALRALGFPESKARSLFDWEGK